MLIRPIEIVIPVYLCDSSLYPIIERCFDSLNEYYPDIKVIGVDDASPLPVPDHWPIVIKNSENLGYTRTVNKGLEVSTAPVVIVANDDLIFHSGCLDRFYSLEGLTIASPSSTSDSPDDRFGCIWGITRQAYALLGPLDERYKHFFSDLAYYHKAKENGVQIIKWPDIVLAHPESATYKQVDKQALFEADLKTFNS